MSLTPSALIALNGITQGSGFVVNTAMTTTMTLVNNNSMISAITSLINTPNAVSGLSATINSLPTCIANASSTAAAVTNQATGMLPASSTLGNQDFILLFNSADTYVSTVADVARATTQFAGQSFGNLGVGVSNYTQVLTNGVPGNLITVGPYLQNFGSVYDFSNLRTVGTAQNLVASLIAQGLDATLGLTTQIATAGYNISTSVPSTTPPVSIYSVPTPVLTSILQGITGSDLTRIITQTSATTVNPVNTAADLLLVESFIQQNILTWAGLATGNPGLLTIVNQLINLGITPGKQYNYKVGAYLSNIAQPNFTSLNNLSSVLPANIAATISSSLGSGKGTYGNPLMSDLIGTVAGVAHLDAYTTVLNAANVASATSTGSTLTTTATVLRSAIVLNSGIPAAYSAFQSAVSAFNSAVSGTDVVSVAIANANESIADSLEQLATETTNLGIAGIALYSGTTSANVTAIEIANFVNKLHDYGTDLNQLDYNTILNGIATGNLAGDAIRATLVEGRNIVNSQAIGKSTPSVPKG